MSADRFQHAQTLTTTEPATLVREVQSSSLGLLDAVLDNAVALSAKAPGTVASVPRLDRFLAEPDLMASLAMWLGKAPRTRPEWERARLLLNRDMARIDELLTDQVNAILHHPEFQKLESSWRGLWLLAGSAQDAKDRIDRDGERGEVKIRVLNVTRKELKRDFDRASEFDQSQLFRKVYEDEYGMAGGEPYGMLVTDFHFSNHPDDMDLLARLSEVAAASFAPIFAAPDPKLLGVDTFATLEQPLDYEAHFSNLSYVKWRGLRDRPDAQFLGMVLPNILMRPPHELSNAARTDFRFSEDVSSRDRKGYLWGSAAWAFAMIAVRAYAECGWFADIRGVSQGLAGGGIVENLPTHTFGTDSTGVAVKTSVEVALSETAEAELSRQGFIPLCGCHDTSFSAFFSNASVHQPKTYDDVLATTNARISAMMQYTLCASRFAHYLKILGRQKIGAFQSAQAMEDFLNRWLSDYITPDEAAPPSVKARYPLRKGETAVREITSKPGSYQVLMHLQPHYQLDQLSAAIQFQTQVAPPSGRA